MYLENWHIIVTMHQSITLKNTHEGENNSEKQSRD